MGACLCFSEIASVSWLRCLQVWQLRWQTPWTTRWQPVWFALRLIPVKLRRLSGWPRSLKANRPIISGPDCCWPLGRITRPGQGLRVYLTVRLTVATRPWLSLKWHRKMAISPVRRTGTNRRAEPAMAKWFKKRFLVWRSWSEYKGRQTRPVNTLRVWKMATGRLWAT